MARIFQALTLIVLLVGGWLMLAPRVSDVPSPAPAPAVLTGQVDRIVIEKSARRLTAYRGDHVLKIYSMVLGFSPDGTKTRQGDGRTPEGLFRIDRRNAASAYHLSLGIDYPRPSDREQAQAAGVDPGGDIFIHGQPNQRPVGEVLAGDWTAGCIALSNRDITELYAATRTGTAVQILP